MISAEDFERMLSHSLACVPEEACGLLGGDFTADSAAVARVVVPVTNVLHSPVRFLMDSQEQFQTFLSFESRSLELVAIYHSHPAGPAHPSPSDLAEFWYPGVVSIILFPTQTGSVPQETVAWQARAFLIEGTPPAWREIPLCTIHSSQPGST